MAGGTAVAAPPDVGLPAVDDRRGHRRRLARRWAALVVALGLLLTATISYRIVRKPGVYWADANVIFLPPASSLFPNTLLNNSGGVITLAGVVGKMVDPDAVAARVVSPTVRLVNQGIRHGWSVTLPNDGGQWANNFDKALLDVQAVGSTAAEVSGTVNRLISQINLTLSGLQAQVPQVDRVTTQLSPSQVQVFYDPGRPLRALAASLAVGLAVTAVTALYLRRRIARGP
ncbi:MAG TPA: hypothetical protein VGJ59_06540 [Jatrophihabitantaceae bacterium]|jgi:hypothetical protein